MQFNILVPAILILSSSVVMAAEQTTQPTSRPVYTKNTDGKLVAIEGTTLVLNCLNRFAQFQDVEVQTDDKTAFMLDNKPVKIQDLLPGMDISVKVSTSTRDKIRKRIIASGPSLKGKLEKIDDKKLLIAVRDGSNKWQDRTISVDDKTVVEFMAKVRNGALEKPRPATLKDLDIGMLIHVIPDTGVATHIWIASEPRQ